ncbi:MAG: DUF5664 domain-containing protein [Candidatus Caldarchaeum sp.]
MADMSQLKQFATGAVRSRDADMYRYDLVTPIGMRRLAETYAEGAEKYGVDNWKKGIPASDLVNHALRHIFLYLAGDTSEDHPAHAVWNLMTLMHFEETRRDLLDCGPMARNLRKEDEHGKTDETGRGVC